MSTLKCGSFGKLDLFRWGEAHARNTDPDTSKSAAADVTGQVANQVEKIVLAALRANPDGLTNHGIVQVTGLPWNTTSPRLRPLVRKKLICDSGLRRSGEGSNKKCIVWKIV